jgi:predicted O-methyltransferase YrrM
MTSLSTPPVSDEIARLFRAAAQAHGRPRHDQPSGDRPRGPHRAPGGPGGPGGPGPARDSMEFFARAKNAYMAVSPRTGTLLYMLARTRQARAVVEFGTSFGISLLHLGAAVKDNGGGAVIGTEFEPGKIEATRKSVEAAGLADVIEVRAGDARETLARDLPDQVDLLFLDGAKEMYSQILALVEPRLAPGAIVAADNASRADGYLEQMRSGGRYLCADVGGDVEISYLA